MFANARMYSVNATTAAAWRTLLEWVVARAGVACDVVDYPAPQPLPDLWSRADMGCAFMCGYPFALANPRPTLLAAPVPDVPRCGGEPIYWTDIVVRADSPLTSLADVLHRRFAWTTRDSQSGYQAPRALFAPFAPFARGAPLFAATVGPLVTPRRVVEAIVAGDADAGPLDSYAHRLLAITEPGLVAPLRVIAATEPTSIPPMVAGSAIAAADATRLTEALLAVHESAYLAPVRATLGLERFARVPVARYDELCERARAADATGYVALD
ncbi:MAG: PhnD/SsuA/transferrin family substrate-binding protein [Burkholderiales bacterium]